MWTAPRWEEVGHLLQNWVWDGLIEIVNKGDVIGISGRFVLVVNHVRETKRRTHHEDIP